MHDETAALELPLSADLERAVAAWLAHLQHERGHADKTLEAYARDVRQFLGFVAQQLGYAPCLADLTRACRVQADWVMELVEEGVIEPRQRGGPQWLSLIHI